MRSSLIIAVALVTSHAAIANEAFIPQSPSAQAIGRDLTGAAIAAIAVPLAPTAVKAAAPVSASNLPANVSGITQQGTRNVATVGQTGGLNQSTIAQVGSFNQAVVTQRR